MNKSSFLRLISLKDENFNARKDLHTIISFPSFQQNMEKFSTKKSPFSIKSLTEIKEIKEKEALVAIPLEIAWL